MSFEVNCPGCQKSYTAEARMVGRKIRCRQCSRVFVVQSSEAASSSSSTLGRTAAGLTGTQAGVNGTQAGQRSAAGATTVLTHPRTQQAGAARPPASANPAAKSGINPSIQDGSEPQPFPGSEILEAWAPLGLCLIAAVWVPVESISSNHTGVAWPALLRIALFAAVYFLLVAPVTFYALKHVFQMKRRYLPPQPRWRIISTFLFPATLAYVFSSLSGVTGFVVGALLGLIVVAIVFWLMFRLDPQETANVYAVVGSTSFGAMALGMLIFMAAGAMMNHAMIASNSAGQYKENPLGPQLAWTVPAQHAAMPRDGDRDDSKPTPSTPTQADPAPATPQPSQPAAASGHAGGPSPALSQPMANGDAAHSPAPAVAAGTVPGEDPDMDPALRQGLFGTGGGAVEGDPFVTGIQSAKHPWVKWAYRPADEGIYEQTLSPMVPSPFVAMFRLPGIGGRTIECCRLAPLYRAMGAIPLGDEGTDTLAVTGRYALSEDGSALLRLINAAAPKVEIVPFRGAGGAVNLIVPAEFTKPGTDPGLITPELLGATPGRHFLVRWTSADQTIVQLYDFQSTGKPTLSLKLGQNDWPGVYAISPDGVWFAAPEREADRTFIAVRSLGNASTPVVLFPTDAAGDSARREPAGICFSPDSSRVAALLERGTDGTVRSWLMAGELPLADGACKVPAADEMLGQIKGRPFDWIAGGKWLVHGRTLLDASTGAVFGTLTDQVVTGQQMADDHTAYLSYLGTDGHPHIAVVKFNPAVLGKSAGGAAKN
jgi:hypothetical protein